MGYMKSAEDFELCARRPKALADPERLRIISCLFGGPKYVGDIATEPRAAELKEVGEAIAEISEPSRPHK